MIYLCFNFNRLPSIFINDRTLPADADFKMFVVACPPLAGLLSAATAIRLNEVATITAGPGNFFQAA